MNSSRPAPRSAPQNKSSAPDAVERALTRVQSEIREALIKLGDDVKLQLNQKLQETSAVFENERKRFQQENDLLRDRANANRILAEIARRELELAVIERELAAMIDDPDIEIAKVIQHRTQQSELKSYIKGLRFQTEDATEAKGR